MQTTILLDDKLFQEAARYARTDNPGELIQLALREFVRNHMTKTTPQEDEPPIALIHAQQGTMAHVWDNEEDEVWNHV